jgi:hypothetical protein
VKSDSLSGIKDELLGRFDDKFVEARMGKSPISKMAQEVHPYQDASRFPGLVRCMFVEMKP